MRTLVPDHEKKYHEMPLSWRKRMERWHYLGHRGSLSLALTKVLVIEQAFGKNDPALSALALEVARKLEELQGMLYAHKDDWKQTK